MKGSGLSRQKVLAIGERIEAALVHLEALSPVTSVPREAGELEQELQAEAIEQPVEMEVN